MKYVMWRSPDWSTSGASTVSVVSTELGWIGVSMRKNLLLRLSFGHQSPQAAGIAVGMAAESPESDRNSQVEGLLERLVRYAAGEFDDFLDIAVETSHLSPFAKTVAEAVRHISYGETRSYGEIAELAGRPRAARAVGRVMAQNRTTLVVPCHRVLGSNGALGGFSAVDGVATKRRLLDLEARCELSGVR